MNDSPPGGARHRRRRTRAADRPPPFDRDPAATLSRRVGTSVAALAVLGTEMRGLLRDRRALFSAFVLPMILYPVLFLSNSWLEKVSKSMLDSRTVRVALDARALDAADARRLRELVAAQAPVEIREIEASDLLSLGAALEGGATVTREEREIVSSLLADRADVLLLARPLDFAPHLALRTYFDGQTDIGNEAERRARAAVSALQAELRSRRVQAVLGDDPAHGLDATAIDVASEAAASGAKLGRFLPLLLVFVLLAGASYAALSAFAGEREAGTLETLLVQPVGARTIVLGKFLAVLSVGIVTGILNAGSVLVSLQFGVGSMPGTGLEHGLILDGARLALAGLLFLPATVFLCAVLCLVCGRARTFREGQQLLLPLLFLAVLPCLPATQGDVSLDAILAAVPLTGPALSMRDALRGETAPLLAAWMFVVQSAWAGLVLSRLALLLDSERIVQGPLNEAELEARQVQSRVAVRWAIVAVFSVYLVGATLQKWHVAWGLAATLWLLLVPLALLSARGTARRARESIGRALWLGAPRVAHVLGALCLAPAFVLGARRYFAWQQDVLPMPSGQGEVSLFQGSGDHAIGLLALVVLSPAICEELFFRGALLSGLRRDLPAWRVIALEMLFFGLVHMSIHRFVPTALLGGVLAGVTLRARSLWPAVILHAAYNGLLVSSELGHLVVDPRSAWLALVGAGLFGFVAARSQARHAADSESGAPT